MLSPLEKVIFDNFFICNHLIIKWHFVGKRTKNYFLKWTQYLIIYTDTESMSVHLINRTLFFKEYKNTSDRIEIYDSVQFCIAIICEKH